METTRWVRVPRAGEATRSDGVFIALRSGAWVYWSAGEKRADAKKLRTPGLLAYLSRAIDEVDALLPPAGWTFSEGIWRSGVWSVRPVENGWGAFRTVRGSEDRASRQTFDSADRARKWAELRFERGDAGLRGPKPRAGARATFKLPDVRVTEEERQFAESIVEGLGVSYSEFVRAALRWAQESVLTEKAWSVSKSTDGVRFQKQQEPA